MVINCKILEDYLNYLSVIKARSHYTLLEYKLDMRLLFLYVWNKRNPNQPEPEDCSFADIDFI